MVARCTHVDDAEELAEEWLHFGRDDLKSAARMLEDPGYHQPRQVCFSAQQAAEKAIKAVCVADQIRFPFTHDLQELTDLLDPQRHVARVPGDLADLSQWAGEQRYPGEDEAEWKDAEWAVELARLVVDAAGEDVEAAR